MKAATTGKTWEVSTSDFVPEKWYFLEVSFHPERGLRLYENGRLVAESTRAEQRSRSAPASYDLDRYGQPSSIASKMVMCYRGICT